MSQADIDRLSHLLSSLLAQHESSSAAKEPRPAVSDVNISEIVLDLLKLLRNLCAGVQNNQQMIV